MKKKRHVILDALRGFAILGIILANFPEFSLWTFSDPSGWTLTDKITRAVQTFFIDGKFYTLFSLLFGIGFSIQLSNAEGRLRTFYRRMAVLLVIGLLHLFFLWSGDILMLYAVCGMLLPLFRKLPARKILLCAAGLLLLPVLLDALFGTSPADPLEREQWRICALYGITEANFGTWLSDAESYREVLQFLHQGSVERMWEFVIGHRFFKVLGLFLIGFAAGKEGIYADIKGPPQEDTPLRASSGHSGRFSLYLEFHGRLPSGKSSPRYLLPPQRLSDGLRLRGRIRPAV